MGSQRMMDCLRDKEYIQLIRCFLVPTPMIQQKESPNPLTEQEVLELVEDGRVEVLQRTGIQVDPIYQLFVPNEGDKIGTIMHGKGNYDQ